MKRYNKNPAHFSVRCGHIWNVWLILAAENVFTEKAAFQLLWWIPILVDSDEEMRIWEPSDLPDIVRIGNNTKLLPQVGMRAGEDLRMYMGRSQVQERGITYVNLIETGRSKVNNMPEMY